MSDMTEELGRLADLRDRGVLTQEEFDQQKAALLNPRTFDAAPRSNATAPAPLPDPVAAPVQPAAPVYTPPPAPAPAAPVGGDEREQLLRAFVGPNADYYMHKWSETAAPNKNSGWNIAAFLLSIFWLFYRKMVNFGLIGAGAFLFVILISSLVHNTAVNLLINGVEIGMAVWIGFNGNRLYRARAEAALAQVHASSTDPVARLAQMRARGGVSLPLALGAAAVWVAAIILITFVLLKVSPAKFAPSGVTSYTAPATIGSTTATSASGGPVVGPAPTPAPVVPTAADDTWLMGQWENVATPSCSQWMRFGADHSLGDNANGSGTWSLAAGPGDGYTLSMNINGDGLRQGPIVRDASAGTITMGSAPNTITWRKTTC